MLKLMAQEQRQHEQYQQQQQHQQQRDGNDDQRVKNEQEIYYPSYQNENIDYTQQSQHNINQYQLQQQPQQYQQHVQQRPQSKHDYYTLQSQPISSTTTPDVLPTASNTAYIRHHPHHKIKLLSIHYFTIQDITLCSFSILFLLHLLFGIYTIQFLTLLRFIFSIITILIPLMLYMFSTYFPYRHTLFLRALSQNVSIFIHTLWLSLIPMIGITILFWLLFRDVVPNKFFTFGSSLTSIFSIMQGDIIHETFTETYHASTYPILSRIMLYTLVLTFSLFLHRLVLSIIQMIIMVTVSSGQQLFQHSINNRRPVVL